MATFRRRFLLPLALAVGGAMSFSSVAAAATLSDAYTIWGYEYYATSTQGRFAGGASGSLGDSATWNAVVNHTPLTTTASITGGYADLITSNLVRVHGTFTSGVVELVAQQPGCGTQTYAVTGDLKKVTRSDSRRHGTGRFDATLIHYRASVLGLCVTFSASVAGTISLDI